MTGEARPVTDDDAGLDCLAPEVERQYVADVSQIR